MYNIRQLIPQMSPSEMIDQHLHGLCARWAVIEQAVGPHIVLNSNLEQILNW